MSGNILVDQATYDRCKMKIAETEAALSELRKNKNEVASQHRRGADWQETPIPNQIAMQEGLLNQSLEELKKAFSQMTIVSTLENESIRVGSTVELVLTEDDEPDKLTILLVLTKPKPRTDGVLEISKASALGKALMGRKVNDHFSYTGNDQNLVQVQILNIT